MSRNKYTQLELPRFPPPPDSARREEHKYHDKDQ